jgi:hypothetical protein
MVVEGFGCGGDFLDGESGGSGVEVRNGGEGRRGGKGEGREREVFVIVVVFVIIAIIRMAQFS